MPHTITFYELIANKAQGRSGPLFQFDLQEHAVAAFDPRAKSQDSHAGGLLPDTPALHLLHRPARCCECLGGLSTLGGGVCTCCRQGGGPPLVRPAQAHLPCLALVQLGRGVCLPRAAMAPKRQMSGPGGPPPPGGVLCWPDL